MKVFFKSILTALLLSGALIVHGQIFQPVGNGLSLNLSHAYASEKLVVGNTVYFAVTQYGNQPSNHAAEIYKWDGTQWSQTTTPPLAHVTAMAHYNGELHIAANNYSYSTFVYKLSGGQWVRILDSLDGGVGDMEIHNNELLLAGRFTESQSGGNHLISYDGNNVKTYPGLAVWDSVSDIEIINNEMWLAGIFSHSWPSDTAHVLKYNRQTSSYEYPAKKAGTSWTNKLFTHSGKVYTYNSSHLYEIRNDSAVSVSNNGGLFDHAAFDGDVYFIQNGRLSVFDGTSVAAISAGPQFINRIAATPNYLYGFMRDTVFNNTTYNHVFKMGPTHWGYVQGRTFVDNNGDCTYSVGVDNKLRFMRFNFGGAAGGTVYMNHQGQYNLALPPGNYNLSGVGSIIRVNKYLQPSASCNSLNLTVTANQTLQHDVAFEHDGTIDAETHFTSWFRNRARYGFQETYRVNVINPGAAIQGPVTLTVTLPPSISFISASPAPSSQSGNILTYQYNALAERDTHHININVRIDTATNSMGDNLCFYSTLSGISNDAVPANNSDTMCVTVVGACDPNDKRPQVEESLPGISQMDYHIRFQNVGTDTAFNVVVLDTLESYFDPASLEMIDASHPYNVSLVDSNILKWSFQDIRLPDSTTNPDKSQGFIRFMLNVDSNLQVGDVIDNDAEIYFDFQPPVHTNHAQTTIVQFVGLAEAEEVLFEVYPNPARDFLWVHNPGKSTLEVRLISITGAALHSQKIAAGNKGQISVGHLKDGLYLLKAEGQTTKILIQH